MYILQDFLSLGKFPYKETNVNSTDGLQIEYLVWVFYIISDFLLKEFIINY